MSDFYAFEIGHSVGLRKRTQTQLNCPVPHETK